jgi:hypothetical protein
MRLPINIGNQCGASPKPSSYLFHHNLLNFKEFSFFAKNAANWHSVCFVYYGCLLVLVYGWDEEVGEGYYSCSGERIWIIC